MPPCSERSWMKNFMFNLIRSLMKLGYVSVALEEYKKATAFLYENLGYTSMEQLREIYDELMEQVHEEQSDMRVILDDLQDDYVNGSVFLRIWRV